MKVGDLVRYNSSPDDPVMATDDYTLGLGIILGFDKDDDPLIHFFLDKTPTVGGDAFFSYNVEVIGESE